MNYIGKSHYQIFFQSKEFPSYHTITHISSKHHTSTQRVSVSLNINHRVAHFKFVTPSLSHDDLCGTSRITMDFQGCNEAWLQRKLVFLDIQRLSSKRATKM